MKTKLRFDASSLVKSGCRLRWKRIVIDGYTEREKYNDTYYGSAFHKFVSTMYETNGDFGLAIVAATEVFARHNTIRKNKQHLTQIHLQKTCLDYWQYFQSKDDFQVLSFNGKPAVEVDFEILIHEDNDYEVYACGTIDKIGKFKSGMFAFGDYKTTSLFVLSKHPKAIEMAVQEYLKQYELATQLNFYYYILKWNAIHNPSSELGKLFSNKFGAFIDGIFLSSSAPTKFLRSDVITNFDYEEMDLLVKQKVLQLVDIHRHGYELREGLINGACIDGKFKCSFHGICNCNDPMARTLMLQNFFMKREFNPLEYSK